MLNQYCVMEILKWIKINCEKNKNSDETVKYSDLIYFSVSSEWFLNVFQEWNFSLYWSLDILKKFYIQSDQLSVDLLQLYAKADKNRFWKSFSDGIKENPKLKEVILYYNPDRNKHNYNHIEYFEIIMNALDSESSVNKLTFHMNRYELTTLPKCQLLRYLYLDVRTNALDLVYLCERNKGLQSLTVLTTELYGNLTDIVPYCDNLEKLIFTIKPDVWDNEYSKLSKLPKLRYLEIRGRHEGAALQNLLHHLIPKPFQEEQLEELHICDAAMNNDEIAELSLIQSLKIIECVFAGRESLKPLKQLGQLKLLSIVTEEDIASLSEALLAILEVCKSSIVISVRNKYLDGHYKSFIYYYGKLKYLKVYLNNDDLVYDGMSHAFLGQLQNVRSLRIKILDVHNSAIRKLLQNIAKFSNNLEYLWLDGKDIYFDESFDDDSVETDMDDDVESDNVDSEDVDDDDVDTDEDTDEEEYTNEAMEIAKIKSLKKISFRSCQSTTLNYLLDNSQAEIMPRWTPFEQEDTLKLLNKSTKRITLYNYMDDEIELAYNNNTGELSIYRFMEQNYLANLANLQSLYIKCDRYNSLEWFLTILAARELPTLRKIELDYGLSATDIIDLSTLSPLNSLTCELETSENVHLLANLSELTTLKIVHHEKGSLLTFFQQIVLNQSPAIEHLALYSPLTGEEIAEIACIKSLKHLSLTYLHHENLPQLAKLTNLVELTIRSSDSLVHLPHLCDLFRALSSSNISSLNLLGKPFEPEIFVAIAQMKSLRELRCIFADMQSIGVLTELPNLEELIIEQEYNYIYRSSRFRPLNHQDLALIIQLTQLKSLHCEWSDTQDLEKLARLTNLQKLLISRKDRTHTLLPLFQQLSVTNTLQQLCIEDTKLNFEETQSLAQIKSLKTLKCGFIPDINFEVLASLKNLEQLEITSKEIERTQLLQILRSCPKLEAIAVPMHQDCVIQCYEEALDIIKRTRINVKQGPLRLAIKYDKPEKCNKLWMCDVDETYLKITD